MTIISKMKELKDKYPEKTAFIDVKTGSKITLREFDAKSDRICSYLKGKKFRKGDKVVVFVPIGIEFYLILTAIFKMGLQAVFIDPYAGIEHINRCCEMISSEGIIGSGKTLLKGFFLRGIRKIGKKINYEKIMKEAETTSLTNSVEDKGINENTPALISFTSGSTGFPKIIMRTHGFLIGQHNVLEKNLKFQEGTAVYSSFPIFLLSHMAAGATVFIPDINWQKPSESKFQDIVQCIRKNNIENIILPPVIFENITECCKKDGIQLNNVQTVYTGGAPVFPWLMEKIRKTFINAEISALYGASEAEPISRLNFKDITEDDIKSMKNGDGLLAGKIVEGLELKIEEIHVKELDRNFAEENSNVEINSEVRGEILVKGENVVNGYLNVQKNPDEKWHRTGDMGYINSNGQLVLLGRVKGRIQIGEKIYYPFAVETAFSFCEILKKSVLTSKNGKLYLLVERNSEYKGNLSENIEIMELKKKFGIYEIVETEIPMDKRHNSKTDYKKLEEIVKKI